jgi:HK97 gp10 family phage protein
MASAGICSWFASSASSRERNVAEVTVEGLKELEAALKTLEAELQVKGIRAGLRAGGVVFRDAMKALVSRSSGTRALDLAQGKQRRHLADDLRVRTSFSGGVPTARIGPGSKTRHIANWLEFGTAPHVIKARRAKELFFPGSGHPITEVHHPGTAPHPFIRPAFDTQSGNALGAFKTVVARQIARFTK